MEIYLLIIYSSAGDVKYHLGVTYDKTFDWLDNHKVTLTMLPNPSHLETVNPLVYGQVRAIQDYTKDKDSSKYLYYGGI